MPFSSRRRFGAVRVDGDWIVVGAPELFVLGPLGAAGRAARRSPDGASSHSERPPNGDFPRPRTARSLAALGLAVIGERLRPEARATVEFFQRQGVELKMLSGDRPATVAAVAADVGIPVGLPVDGRELPESSAELAALLRERA